MFDDTIAAIATASGAAGIGIIRISGDMSIEILKKIFRNKKKVKRDNFEAKKVYYGYICDEFNNLADEVIVFVMRAPLSYTTENVVEIQCHGGSLSLRKIMGIVLSQGARLAEAGEFTKRAFLNGRIDLSQAEAVIDVISAKTDMGLDTAVNQLEGVISEEVYKNSDLLLDVLAHIEASIDFPEHDIEDVTINNIEKLLTQVRGRLELLIESFHDGKIVKDGVATAIIGKPNVGKSSLLNVLLKENRAIVTDVPGTTRDVIEEYITMGAILLKLIDTAGIRYTEDQVEKLGVERTIKAIDEADLVLFVCDISKDLTDEDREIIRRLSNKKVLVICNKIDRGVSKDIEELGRIFGDKAIIKMSVIEKKGIDSLEENIKESVFCGEVKTTSSKLITSIRHKNLLSDSLSAVNRAIEAMELFMPIDLLSVDIKEAWSKLGEITGGTVSEDIINEIFQKFCIGK